MSKFFAVSTGPSTPKYMTLEAVEVLEKCGTIFYPITRGNNHVSFDCIKEVIDISKKKCIGMNFSMTRDSKKLQEEYDGFLAQIRRELSQTDVAVIAIGDVSVYSTAARIAKMLKEEGQEVHLVSGVTSFCAAAGSCALDLAETDEGIRIVPGDAFFESGKIPSVLEDSGTKIFMKSPRHLKEIIGIIKSKGLCEKTYLVQEAGYDTQKIFCGDEIENLPEEIFARSYMTTLIVM